MSGRWMKAARGAAAREPLGGETSSPAVEEQRLRHPDPPDSILNIVFTVIKIN